MNMFLATVLSWCITTLILSVVEAEDNNDASWSYSDYANYGPSQWALVAFDDDAVTNECDGSSQSPIEISLTSHCNSYIDYKVRSERS